MDERKLLAAIFQDRKTFDLVAAEVDATNLSPEAEAIYGYVRDYYAADDKAACCDLEILVSRAERETTSNKVSEVIAAGLRTIASLEVSSINVGKEIIALRQQALGSKIASRLASGKYVPEIKEWMGQYIQLGDAGDQGDGGDEEIFSGVSAEHLAQSSFSKEGLIPLFPKVLNDAIDGGVRGGHHILVFAPTEMGKSLIALNFCYGFLKHGLKVLYCGNEDPAADLIMRMMTRLTGMTKYEIQENTKKADDILSHRNWSNFIFASMAPGTFPKIRKLVDKYEPDVVILDQLRNLDVFSENRTQSLEKAATEARNLAKTYDIPVISVTQAADSASGKTILGRGDVDGSNVGIPAQVDLMLGVGATLEMEQQNYRSISLVKNKLSGRHSPIQVQIDPFTSRVIE